MGQLFSDGWLDKFSFNSNPGFRFKQSITRDFYVISSYLSLSHYCSRLPYLVKSQRKGNFQYALEFSTRALPCFKELYLSFYRDKVKVTPKNIFIF